MDNIKKKRLLIIDSEQNCTELCRLLSEEYNISAVRNIGEAIAILEEQKEYVDALLINSRMEEDLCTAVDIINKSTRFSSIPILILADENVSDEQFKYLGAGAVDCISKPYNAKTIINRIENAIILKDSMTFYSIEKMLKQLPSNIYLKDNEGRYVFATKYWHHLKKPDNDPNWTIRGKTDPEIRKDKENAEEALKKDLEIIKTGKGTSYTIEINEGGKREFLQIIKQPLFNDDGSVSGIVGLINDVTEFELLKKKLRERAIIDELTGMYNRAYFKEFIRLQSSNCYPIGIISADCDDLKTINDTYGHKAGDDYIKAAVDLFKLVLPEESFVFRMGGDEFIIMLPSASKETAVRVVEQLKSKEKLFLIEGRQLSVSYGTSVINGSDEDIDMCIAESDRNMYIDKNNKKRKNSDKYPKENKDASLA